MKYIHSMKITWVKALQKKYIKKLPKRCNNEKKILLWSIQRIFLNRQRKKHRNIQGGSFGFQSFMGYYVFSS